MRTVIQRVLEAKVVVDGKTVSGIGPGLLVLLGVGRLDTEQDAAWLAEKIRERCGSSRTRTGR